MKYIIRDREAGNEVATFNTMEEARAELMAYEEQDKKDETYTEDFYEIVETPNAVDRIKKIRRDSGLTQKKFAEVYNIPQRTLQNWEYGVNEAPEYLLDLLEADVDRSKAPKLHLTAHYQNGNALEWFVNYVHVEDGTLYFTVDSNPHPVFQEPVKISLENLVSWDIE